MPISSPQQGLPICGPLHLPEAMKLQTRHRFNAEESAMIEEFTRKSFKEERDMYRPFTELLQALLQTNHKRITVMNTHNKFYLYGRRADITLLDATYEHPHPACVWQLVELSGPYSPLDSEEFRGQCLDYLHKLQHGQSWRQYFSIMFANQTSCHWLFVYSGRYEVNIQISSKLPLVDGLAHLVDLLENPDYRPRLPEFALAEGKINKVLGITRHCIVASSTRSQNQVAIKRVWCPFEDTFFTTLEKEVKMLEKIKGHMNLPQRTSFTPDYLEFAFTPVGESLSALRVNEMPSSLPLIMTGIGDGLVHHGLDIIHRDIRWENIILDENGKAVIIDFNAATIANVPVQFSGGYICCPLEILQSGNPFAECFPVPAHDWRAYLLLLHSAIFPHFYTDLDAGLALDNGSQALIQLWSQRYGNIV